VDSLNPETREERRDSTRDLQLVLAAQQGRRGARAELVEAFMAAITRVARLYRGTRAVDSEGLTQAGVVGLLRALDRYDPTLGTPFWAYATWWVRQAMQQFVSELALPVVLSDRAARQLACVRHAERDRLQSGGKEPTPREIEVDTGLASGQSCSGGSVSTGLSGRYASLGASWS